MAEHHRNRNSAIQRIALVLTCAIAFTLLAPPRAANAQDAFSCIEELTDDEVRYRIRYIEGKMKDAKPQATRWRYVWMSLWLAGGGGMTYAAVNAARDNNTRTSSAGLTSLEALTSSGSLTHHPRAGRLGRQTHRAPG